MKTCPLRLMAATDPAQAGERSQCPGEDCAWWTKVWDEQGRLVAERCAVPLMAIGAVRRMAVTSDDWR